MKSLIYNYAMTIPGKYYSNPFFSKNPDENNKIKIIKRNIEEIIIGWKIPDEQRIHNYKIKYNISKKSYFELIWGPSEQENEIIINLIERNKNPNQCLLPPDTNKIELYYNDELTSTYIVNSDIIENDLKEHFEDISLEYLNKLFLDNNYYNNYNDYIKRKISDENEMTFEFTKEDFINNNKDLEYNYYKEICKLDDFDKIFYNIIYKYIFSNIENFIQLKKKLLLENQKNQENINYIISRNSRSLSIFNFIFYNNYYSITLPNYLPYENEEIIININNNYGNLCFQKVQLDICDETKECDEIFIKKFNYFYDYPTNSIVVSIAGTDTSNFEIFKSDIQYNINSKLSFLYIEELNDFILCHQGFVNFARNIFNKIGVNNYNIPIYNSNEYHYDEINDRLKEEIKSKFESNREKGYIKPLLEKYNNIREILPRELQDTLNIVFTGHSLGGATAECLYLLFMNNEFYKDLKTKMKFIGYSSPRVHHILTENIYLNFISKYESNIMHIFNEKDVVTKIPNSSLFIKSMTDYTKSSPVSPLMKLAGPNVYYLCMASYSMVKHSMEGIKEYKNTKEDKFDLLSASKICQDKYYSWCEDLENSTKYCDKYIKGIETSRFFHYGKALIIKDNEFFYYDNKTFVFKDKSLTPNNY